MKPKVDRTGYEIKVNDTVLFYDREGASLIEGSVIKITEKMVHVKRAWQGWPQEVSRYPEQVVVVRSISSR
jgi:hypothetical protein